MVQSASKLITVDEFITQYSDSDRYELIDGELINMEPITIEMKTGLTQIQTHTQ